MSLQEDISSILISEQAVQKILPSILVDAVVLNEDYTIAAVSQNVLGYLGYTSDDLKNQSVNYLSGDKDLGAVIRKNLAAGYFNEKRSRLLTKDGQWISVSITGFYLGLISDMNGSIILKIKNLDELDRMNKQLLQKKAELDDFIYRTSHDLRGPLATIKGLVNLLRMRKNDDELDSLVSLLRERTDKLDERLSQISYLTQVDREVNPPTNVVDFKEIGKMVRKIASESTIPAFIKVQYSAPPAPLYGLNEIHVQSLISNLLLHVLSLPISRLDSRVLVKLTTENSSLKIKVGALGFMVDENLKEALSRSEFIYSDILNYPLLVNYYTAKKMASGFQSQINYQLIADDKQRLWVEIPYTSTSPFKQDASIANETSSNV